MQAELQTQYTQIRQLEERLEKAKTVGADYQYSDRGSSLFRISLYGSKTSLREQSMSYQQPQ